MDFEFLQYMNRRGFTLIEMLVVMSVFLTLMLVVSDIFLSVSLNQRKAMNQQQAMADLQFTFEQVAQVVRLAKVDYEAMAEPIAPLTFVDNNGDKIGFYQATQNCANGAAACLIMKKNGLEKAISAATVDIDEFTFAVTPKNSPYVYDEVKKQYLNNEQPLVFLLLKATIKAGQAADQKQIVLQTTVDSRHYER